MDGAGGGGVASNYKKLGVLGRGTYGEVEKAKDRRTGRVVAIKRIMTGKSPEFGVHWTALREIKLLQELRHPNIVGLLDVFVDDHEVHLVMDFAHTDLEKVMKTTPRLPQPHIKAIIKMLLEAVACFHEHWVLHRDIKPSNLLLTQQGELKLSDLGLARNFGTPEPHLTANVCTSWYRPPELFFGATKYDIGVDMWSVGCVMGELLNGGKALFCGNTEIEILGKIFEMRGSPTEESWPGLSKLPAYIPFEHVPQKPLSSFFPGCSSPAISLLSSLLTLNPNARPTAKEALAHEYFSTDPLPSTPEEISRDLIQKNSNPPPPQQSEGSSGSQNTRSRTGVREPLPPPPPRPQFDAT